MEKRIFDYQTDEQDFNLFDIFESGGDVIAKSVKWEFVELITNSLNNYYMEKSNEFKVDSIPDFLRMCKVVKSFTVNGHKFKEGDEIPQVQTPIGAKRSWNLLYCYVNNKAVGVNVKNIRQILS